MKRPELRTHTQDPARPPKRRCVRGHVLAKVGWVLSPCSSGSRQAGYTVRRCKACLRQDVQRRANRVEQTSKKVARISGRVLAIAKNKKIRKNAELSFFNQDVGVDHYLGLTWGEVLSLAGSAETQAPNKKKAVRRKKAARR